MCFRASAPISAYPVPFTSQFSYSFPMLAIPMAAAIGIAKKNVSREKATAQSLRFMSSFISLKNKLFDVISCHLRFTDKDLFQ